MGGCGEVVGERQNYHSSSKNMKILNTLTSLTQQSTRINVVETFFLKEYRVQDTKMKYTNVLW